MKFYLQTLDAREFLEVNQALTLAGVYTDPVDFTRREVDVNETLHALLEVMSDEQTILLYCISNGFRNILGEARHLQAFSSRLHLAVPADGQGYMTLKAAKQLHLPIACGRIYTLEQAACALHNGADQAVLDLERISCFSDPQTLLHDVLALADRENGNASSILVSCQTIGQFRMAISLGASAVSAPKTVYDQMLYSVLSASQTAGCRDEWILTYTRTEVLDAEPASAPADSKSE